MSLAARLAALAWLLAPLAGCEGLGRPIVGLSDPPDGSAGRTCEVLPADCVPLRGVAEDHFALPERMPPYQPPLDCDGDEVEEDRDTCPGFPNRSQQRSDCAAAQDDCARLRSGERRLAGADLRGCAVAGPIALGEDLDLTGAQLACAELRLVVPDGPGADRRRVVIDDAQLLNLWLSVEGPVELSMNRTRADGSRLALEGGATLDLHDSILRNTSLWVDPRATVGEGAPGPGVDVRRSNLELVTIREPGSERALRVRVDDSTLNTSALDVPSLEIFASAVVGTRLRADAMALQEVTVTSAELSGEFVSVASSQLDDVIFARCVDLRFSDSEVSDADIPACPPERFRALRSELEAVRLGGGAALTGSELLSSVVVGAGPESGFTATNSVVDGTHFCAEIGAAAFFEGEVRCTGCAPEAFGGGERVCVTGTALFERGCPAIELAPQCE